MNRSPKDDVVGAARRPPSSEQDVLARLAQALPAKEYVIHPNVAWKALGHEPPGRSDGEADVVICHPRCGVLVLEVKGGGIDFDMRASEWFSTDRAGARRRIDDPMKQADASARHILAVAKSDSLLSHGGRGLPVPVGSAVVLPNLRWKKELPLHWPEELVIDEGDLQRPREAIDRAFAYWASRHPRHGTLDAAQWRHLNWKLAPRGSQVMSLRAVLADEERELVELTAQQLRALAMLRNFSRLKVKGCAGSGKTILAVEEARRLSAAGSQVLLLCYNRLLAEHLQRVLVNTPGVLARSFHHLCRDICATVGAQLPEPAPGENEATFWRERFPSFAFEQLERYPTRFDAVIVDEGQDFRPDWWAMVELLLAPAGRLAVLYDPNQDIFHTGCAIPVDLPPIELTANCRSTAAINRTACAAASLSLPSEPGSVEGEAPTIIQFNLSDEVPRQLGQRLERLVDDEHLGTESIIVLSPRRREHSCLAQCERVGRFRLVEGTPRPREEVRYATFQSFKGLESDIVLMVDLDLDHKACSPQGLYVAFSRAKHRLVIWVRRSQHERLAQMLDVRG